MSTECKNEQYVKCRKSKEICMFFFKLEMILPSFTTGQDILLVSLFLTHLCSFLMSYALCSCRRGREAAVCGTWGPLGHRLVFLTGLGASGLGLLSFCFNSEGDSIFPHKQANKQTKWEKLKV